MSVTGIISQYCSRSCGDWVMSRSDQGTPRSAATRSMTARASSHRWQPGRDSSVIWGVPVITVRTRPGGGAGPVGAAVGAAAVDGAAVLAGKVRALKPGGVVARLAEQVGDRRERGDLGGLQAELAGVGGA